MKLYIIKYCEYTAIDEHCGIARDLNIQITRDEELAKMLDGKKLYNGVKIFVKEIELEENENE